MSVIVLCGGGINYRNLPIATASSNSMISVNGKPVIGWILDDLIDKGLTQITIVLQTGNKKLHDFVKWAYSERCVIQFAYVQEKGSILNSLLSGLNTTQDNSPVHVILGDTLIRDPFNFDQDTIYSGDYTNPLNWCLVSTADDGTIESFYDKCEIKREGLEAVAGYYFITDLAAFREAVLTSLDESYAEISRALEIYSRRNKIYVKKATEWYDFGHIDHLISAKRKLLQTRFFNSLAIDEKRGVIVKSSIHSEKLKDELNWYKLLPSELQILIPRIIDRQDMEGHVRIEQELYGYPNLAELYVFGELDFDIWARVIDKLFDVHNLFLEYQYKGSQEDLQEMYQKKTLERLKHFQKNSKLIPQYGTIKINGKEFLNLPELLERVNDNIDALCFLKPFAIIHGDYCFSNILYDLHTEVVRLIDPRGSFGRKGIYGDPRYDVAKLRHSISGMYDFIIADLFHVVERNEREFEFTIYNTLGNKRIGEYFDRKVVAARYSISEIILIEGLLFLSMLPFHEGKSKRQQAMYLTGVQLLNQIIS